MDDKEAVHEAPESVDPFLWVGVGLVAGGLAVVAPCPVAITAAAIVAMALHARRGSLVAASVVAAALAVGFCRGEASLRRHEIERATADAAIPQPARCSAHGVVDSSPIAVRGTYRWDARLDDVVCDGAAADWTGRATLYGGPDDLARHDEVDVVGTLAPPQRLWNVSTGDPRPSETVRAVVRTGGALDVRVVRRARGLLPTIDHWRAEVRRRIEQTFDPEVSPMARALVLGESDLAPDDDRAFRASGLSHLLAVSGMHLILILAVAVRVLEGILRRIENVAARVDVGRLAAAVGIPTAWLYAEFAGAGGSTLRAAAMATVALAARALGRRTDGTRAFALSMVAMAVAEPLIAFDLSFTLSAGATAGLLAFARPLGARFESHVPARLAGVGGGGATTLAASVPCVPILARFAPTVPLGGVVANVVAVPLGELAALPLCLAHALMARWPDAERGCALVASGALRVVRAIARTFALPALTAQVPLPTAWQLGAFSFVLAAVALRPPGRAALVALGVGSLVLMEVCVRRFGSPRGVLRATFLDVGQGDSAVVDLPDGEALVVDGGGLVGSPIDVGASVLAPELRARRRQTLAFVALTHPHPDHFGGFVSGLGAVALGAFWDTGQGEIEHVGGAYATVLDDLRARGVPVLRPSALCGSRMLGDVRIEVLAPCPGPTSDRNPNDNSFVLRLTYGTRALLLVGDAEREEENDLLTGARSRLKADVLKVGHHGSATSSTPAFLAAVAPSEAIISVGRRNRFGHPHPATLATLAASGARIWRTDRDGAVTVTTDGRSLEVERASRLPP